MDINRKLSFRSSRLLQVNVIITAEVCRGLLLFLFISVLLVLSFFCLLFYSCFIDCVFAFFVGR